MPARFFEQGFGVAVSALGGVAKGSVATVVSCIDVRTVM